MTENCDKREVFSDWIHCICIVTFDLELGQKLEAVYPQNVKLSEQEKMNICYLAFPDSNSGCMGDTKFHICLRVAPDSNNALTPNQLKYNSECLPILKADPGHYFGFVYFRQVKDATSKRGYFQKSVVFLSRLPFISLFYEITSFVAPIFFDNGISCLEAASENIAKWPRLGAGKSLNLHLLGSQFQVVIPSNYSCKTNNSDSSATSDHNSNFQSNSTRRADSKEELQNETDDSSSDSESSNSNECDDNDNHQQNKVVAVQPISNPSPSPIQRTPQATSSTNVLSSIYEIDIFNSLYSVISHIHLLWELILTSEPVVVMASSPTDCSHMVQSLISLIAPLQYCGELRPYFTIHDSEFKEFTQSAQGPVPCILGVTNPYFSKTLQHWPHTIRLSEPLNINHNNDNNHTAMGSFNAKKLTKVKSISKLLGVTSGVCTQYKPYLQKDKAIIKKIYAGVKTKRPSVVQSAIIKRYFLELTQSFMIPLERYMASLMPLQKDISPFKAPPSPHQFKQDNFLATLEQSGPQLTSSCRGDFEGLYKRFFRSSNFKGWYEQRYLELQQTLQSLQLQALSQADLNKWVQGKQEVEIVDMILRIKQKLHIPATSNSSLSSPVQSQSLIKKEVREQLLHQLEDMKSSLPEDLKMILS